jgi:hypothetical protein
MLGDQITSTESLIAFSYILCAGGSLVLFVPAFWKERPKFFPNFPYNFPHTYTDGFPTLCMRFLWLFGIAMIIGMALSSILCDAFYFRLCCVLQTFWAATVMFVDESFWGPQMIHFMVTTMALGMRNVELLRYYLFLFLNVYLSLYLTN